MVGGGSTNSGVLQPSALRLGRARPVAAAPLGCGEATRQVDLGLPNDENGRALWREVSHVGDTFKR